jgi:hypothetical protein
MNMVVNAPFAIAAAFADLNPQAVASSAAKHNAALRAESCRAIGICAASTFAAATFYPKAVMINPVGR